MGLNPPVLAALVVAGATAVCSEKIVSTVDRPTVSLAATSVAVTSAPPRAPVRGCRGRIGVTRQKTREDDTVVGPLRFNMSGYSPLPAWRRMVSEDQWLKSVARLRAGAQVTLEVPREQRSWMRLEYAHRRGGRGVRAVTLRACRHRRSRAAQRRECGWAEGVIGRPGQVRDDYRSCRAGPTFFSGGFTIDYETAPQQGRCAELIVWVKGERQQHRVGLLRTEPGECA
jgi:hypothetical protein